MHDGVRMLVVDSDKSLRVIDTGSLRELSALPEFDAVTSICASQLRDDVLVSIAQQIASAQRGPVIRLWDIAARRVTQRFTGHCQGRFVVRCCFGGPLEEFVFSGSEDAQVYVWHRQNGSLLHVLPGHSSTVNSVCWIGAMLQPSASPCAWLISASDDHSLRVWGSSSMLASAQHEGDVLEAVALQVEDSESPATEAVLPHEAASSSVTAFQTGREGRLASEDREARTQDEGEVEET